MAVGLKQAQWPTRLIGIAIDAEEKSLLEAHLTTLANDLGQDWGLTFRDQEFEVNRSYLGAGYGVVGDPERQALRLLAREEGIILDPVYSGRAFAGLLGLIRSQEFSPAQRVLFWHTGGIPALFAYGDCLGAER